MRVLLNSWEEIQAIGAPRGAVMLPRSITIEDTDFGDAPLLRPTKRVTLLIDENGFRFGGGVSHERFSPPPLQGKVPSVAQSEMGPVSAKQLGNTLVVNYTTQRTNRYYLVMSALLVFAAVIALTVWRRKVRA